MFEFCCDQIFLKCRSCGEIGYDGGISCPSCGGDIDYFCEPNHNWHRLVLCKRCEIMAGATGIKAHASRQHQPPNPNTSIQMSLDEARTVSRIGMVILPVAPGEFMMGSDSGDAFADEKPVHKVRITHSYWLGKYPVTQKEWQAIMGNKLSRFKDDNLPVEQISWDDAVKFCEKLAERERSAGRLPTGYVYRLPTEAEWEYAARGGSASRGYTYSGSNKLGEVGWYDDNSGMSHPVGKKKANELGFQDMSGNVNEWCHDWFRNYTATAQTDPVGPVSDSGRVYRGGGWSSIARSCRPAYRGRGTPSYTNYYLGFRVCLAPPVQ